MVDFNDHPKSTRPRDLRPDRETTRRLADNIDQVRDGRVNWLGEFSVANAATSTTVYDDRVRESSHVSLMPLDATAAALMNSIYFSAINEGRADLGVPVGNFVLTHAAPSGRADFRYCIKW